MAYEIENRKLDFTAARIHQLLPAPHLHSHLELIYVKKGSSRAVLDRNTYLLKEGDLFLAFPNQIHFYQVVEPVEGYMLIFSPVLFGELKEIFQTKLPVFPILHQEQLPMEITDPLEAICRKLNPLRSGEMAEGRTGSLPGASKIAAKGWLLMILGEILPLMDLTDNPADQDTIKQILKYCMENYTRPLSLSILSRELNLNQFYISHIFRERMKMSYKEFIQHLRVEHACSLLEKGENITEIAYASGFSSVRTFNRAFLAGKKMPPREFRKLQLQQSLREG